MKSLVALVLLAQLFSCKAGLVPDVPPEILPKAVLGCDDPETEAAAQAVEDHMNRHLKHGYKVRYNRIENVVRHERRPHGHVWNMEMEFVETTCHIVDPKPAPNCTVRRREEHAVEGECDVKMVEAEGQFKVVHANCHSSPDSSEDFRRSCPECTHMTELNDTDVVNTVHAALAEFNAKNTTNDHYKLLEISRGHHSHLSKGVFAEFAIVNTNCTAHHDEEHADDCHVATGDHLHYGFCKAAFHKGMGEGAADHHEVHCTIFEHQAGVTHDHLVHEHMEGKLPPAGRGFRHLDMKHSFNGPVGSHSHSDEVPPPEKPAALAKRSILRVAAPGCPGKYHHYEL